ncbi:MAG TPA: UDP-N-acetylmuramate dehydrogenase [Clostridiaceae bacterium]
MKEYTYFAQQLGEILDIKNIDINDPMKKHTSFKVGGPADVIVTPENFDEVSNIIKVCNLYKVPFYIIGNGTNLLVKDGGIRGVVIKLAKLKSFSVKADRLIAEGGVTIISLSRIALKKSLTGLEFACGIPGTVGGAVTMNAGAYNGEISQVIESALVIDKNGDIIALNKEDLELGYRMSAILKYGYTVLQVVFKLEKGDPLKISDRMAELTRRRIEKQPLEYPSAGSTFKRPTGSFAPKLIEESGLKGVMVGGAEVSIKHSGFIINKGEAKAKDIIDLITMVQDTVKEKFDIKLETEVIIIGEDPEDIGEKEADSDRSAIII